MTPALQTEDLVMRYGKAHALDGCTATVPAGRITALVGPNGAGKTTLLHCAVGLLSATSGSICLLGGDVRTGMHELLPRVGFVAQDAPLYRSFSVADMIEMGRRLNQSWNAELVRSRLRDLDIPLPKVCGALSGGQQAQVALSLALAKRPELLILDEPVASLDPLARREFLESLMSAVADHGLSVLLSSHLIADLERICDHLIVLTDGRVQLAGDVDDLLEEHLLLVGPRADSGWIARGADVVEESHTDRQSTVLVRGHGPRVDPRYEVSALTLEDLVLAYLRRRRDGAAMMPRAALEVPA